ncbi:adenine-specific methyltransferase EcoRI family protein [Christensenellaceae bacterium OttesenSCG-928-L17]|nr:adenine-specific methyltransferase EcoRI family protein [Christensenellaceae bacterium OttesenSCG-928-L17]
MANDKLAQAKNTKNDEFYTQWADIEREVQAYLEYDPDVFRGKTILCPCDDPEWSNFTKFFALHFQEYGLRKLISTSYAPDSKNYPDNYQLTLFEQDDPKFDADKTRSHGKIFILDSEDKNHDGIINIDDLQWDYLEGDGDFRSDEVKALLTQSDIIVTNPPFSLFREFLAWIVEADKKFLVVGNMNAITYKEVFPLIMGNEVWLGKGFKRGCAHFLSPTPTDSKWIEMTKEDFEAQGIHVPKGFYVTRVAGLCWFTNLEHGRRHQPLPLMTMADNLKFSKHKEIKGKAAYDHYDNYDAIEVSFTDAIPSDYDGVMGVPISFLDKYCPEQFEIIGYEKSYHLQTKTYPLQIQVDKNGKRSNVSKLNDGTAIKVDAPPDNEIYYIVDGEYFVQRYKRILIRKKGAEQ